MSYRPGWVGFWPFDRDWAAQIRCRRSLVGRNLSENSLPIYFSSHKDPPLSPTPFSSQRHPRVSPADRGGAAAAMAATESLGGLMGEVAAD